MWMLRPFTQPREVTIDLPPLLVESLGVGAEVLASYLTTLAEAAANEPDPSKHPAPDPVLCRVCERQITPWWFEKHSDLCLQEHRSEMDVQIAQENLNEHRHAIVKVLDNLEERQSRPLTGDGDSPPAAAATAALLGPQPEYKGLPIGSASPANSAPSSGVASGSSSAPATPPRSREQSTSSMGHSRGRSFAVRRPLIRIVELILDLCDTALEINMPVIKESRTETADDFRTLSPQSESRISQVAQWQSPSTNTLEQEQGLAALSVDTEQVCRAKVDAVIRHRKIVEYAERIRIEYTVLVEECITAALSKAERIAAGQLSDSSEDEALREERENIADTESAPMPVPGPAPAPPTDAAAAPTSSTLAGAGAGASASAAPVAPAASASTQNLSPEPSHPPVSPHPSASALTMSIRNSADGFQLPQPDVKSSSAAVSTGPSSPIECPTPRSHKSGAALSTSQPSRRGLSLTDNDAGENSDGSALSSAAPGALRTDSPSSDRSLDRKRRSLVLPGLNHSPKRQPSPARISGPHSPLRMPKPRLSSGADSLPSPMASPSTNASELALHYPPHINHHHMHHRRQSSATSSDAARPPVSPRMTQHQPRPAPPSIKDFEIIKPISKGAFGSVYLSKKKTTGEYFAIKVLKKADMITKNQTSNVKAERAIMMLQGESDFVAKLYWTFSSKEYLYLVMEYLNGGDCASLVKVLGGLPEDWAKKYIAEVVLGVEHLHGKGIVHRDLKPDNLLIDQTGHLKLTDFGLSRMGLVGRQKRLLKSLNESEPAPDPLKPESFRATSITSSRSASFDFQGAGHSPGSTPLITPDVSNSMSQPSYFNLNQSGLSRQSSRRESGYRSDSVGSDHLNSVFRNFSLYDSSDPTSPAPIPTRSSTYLPEEEGQSEASESPYLYPLQPSVSNQTSYGTPPQQSMMPPLMALFDPEDHNRRFVGTPDYLAPETINGLGQDEMSDWWSLGCIMFEFLFGYPPFNAATPDEVFDNILHRRINWPDEIEELATPESIDLVNKLMTMNPRERLGANVEEKYPNGGAEIRSHPWFSDVNFETLLEDKAQFVPNLENLEDTEYFDPRGATAFAEEQDDRSASQQPMTSETPDRPHDALFKVRNQQPNSMKRHLKPLSIPPHVRDSRDSRSRRLSEPVASDDFGNFSFKNLGMLDKANKDVIQKLKNEALQAHQRQSTSGQGQNQSQHQAQGQQQPVSAPASQQQQQQQQEQSQQAPPAPPPPPQPPQTPSGPSLEGSPLPISLQRTMSQSKGNRPASPSHSQANSSPSRPSQPSSPLLVQFSTGQNNHERRKTSGSSSTNSHQSSGSFPFGSVDQGRVASAKQASTGSSPVKGSRIATHSPDKTPSGPRQGRASRARSQTVGSQDGELTSSLAKESYVPTHSKRRSQLFDASPSSSDNEDPRTKALLKVQRRRQSSRRLSQINLLDGPFFRPLDVLICEDHPISRIVMERLFEKLRCRTISAANGAEATSYALSEVQFDIIMTEYKLPQVNGADFARMVRETRGANRSTPIIAVTGYLKDLPEIHHFDSLIEKPPTLTKLTEALCEFCQWKPPPKDYNPSQPMPVPPSAPRYIPMQTEDSPSSTTSSSLAHVAPSSYRGSSREDSISSLGDSESVKTDDVPVIVSRQPDEWSQSQGGGLGISDDGAVASEPKGGSSPAPTPQLLHASSAPEAMNTGTLTPRKQRSSESIRAKRESLEKKRYECAESGDDEDEELGNTQTRTHSPQNRNNRPGSKLGIEMMRTNSRGSVVSGSEEILQKEREALRRSQSRGSDDVCEVDEEPFGSPSDKALEDDLDKLQISESAAGELSPTHSQFPEIDSNPDTSIEAEAEHSPVGRNRSGTLIRGQITPPIMFSQEEDDELSASMIEPDTPTIKMFESSAGDREIGGEGGDNDQNQDAEATPRPLHTPTLNLDAVPTPRKPSSR